MKVEISHETKRGCGYRTPGAARVGIYLVGPSTLTVCERLPFPLTICPCCGHGIRFSRGFTWIDPIRLFDPTLEPRCDYASEVSRLLGDLRNNNQHDHNNCPVCNPWMVGDQAGLMWVGEKYYPSPHHFIREAREMGVSKKISGLPKDFKIGEHVIYLGHHKAYTDWDDASHPVKPGVFMAFTPVQVDLVIDNEHDIPPKALAMKKDLGDQARLVKVVRETQKTLIQSNP